MDKIRNIQCDESTATTFYKAASGGEFNVIHTDFQLANKGYLSEVRFKQWFTSIENYIDICENRKPLLLDNPKNENNIEIIPVNKRTYFTKELWQLNISFVANGKYYEMGYEYHPNAVSEESGDERFLKMIHKEIPLGAN